MIAGELDILKAAVPAYEQMLRGPTKAEAAEILAVLTKAMAILGGGWPIAQRKEWIDVVGGIIVDMPAYFVMPVLNRVLRSVGYASEFLKAVTNAVEPDVARMLTEQRHVLKAIELAETPLP